MGELGNTVANKTLDAEVLHLADCGKEIAGRQPGDVWVANVRHWGAGEARRLRCVAGVD